MVKNFRRLLLLTGLIFSLLTLRLAHNAAGADKTVAATNAAITVASTAPPAATEWDTCQTASQCAMVTGNCGVEWAVNKKFVEISKKKPPRPDGPCKKPLEDHPSTTMVICVEARCILYPSGTYAGGKSIDPGSCVIADCWGHLGCNYLTCTKSNGSKYMKYAQ